MLVLWMRRASFTSCPGLMMSSTWQATGSLLEHWRRYQSSYRCWWRGCECFSEGYNLCFFLTVSAAARCSGRLCCGRARRLSEGSCSFGSVCAQEWWGILTGCHNFARNLGHKIKLPGGINVLCFALHVSGVQKTEEEIVNEIVKLVRDTVGPVAAFKKVLFVRGLPKTRSGKIPRSSLSNLVNGKPYKVRLSC